MRPRIIACALIVLAAVFMVCASAGGSEPPAADPAQLFADAQERFDKQDFEAALPIFQQAYAATESPNARIYVARCLRELGRLPEAYDEMQATSREATRKAEAEAKYVPTRDSAAAELAMLEQRVAKLIVNLSGAVEGTQVLLGGKPLSAEQLGVPITLMPGSQTIVVTAPGRPQNSHDAKLEAGRTRSITVMPGAEPAGPAQPTSPSPVQPVPDQAGGGLGGVQIAGFVVAGVGLAAMGVMIGTNLAADSKLATLEDECGGTRCTDPQYQDTIDSGKTLETVANVSLIAGAVLIAGGVAMVIFGPSAEPDGDTATLRIAPGVSPDGAYLGLHGSF